MNILTLDTSTDACSAALMVGNEVFDEFVVEPRRHTHLILPMVERLLAKAGITAQDLDVIGFGRGPGSFAGIRIATGVAQGLALGAGCPLVPVSTLQAMALSVADKAEGLPILALLDARMDEVYGGSFNVDGHQVEALSEEYVCAPAAIPVGDQERYFVVGSGLAYQDKFSDELSQKLTAYAEPVYPQARHMLTLTEQAFNNNQQVAPEDALPVYLRDGTWKKKDEQ